MKLVVYSVILNQHQAPIADELWELTSHSFCFVELANLYNPNDLKGGTEDYSDRLYLLKAWKSKEAQAKAMELARTAECCIFSSIASLPYEKERMHLGLLSFDMSERWFKHGWKSLVSLKLLQWLWTYYFGGWNYKPLYKLCIGAFTATDHYRLGTFKKKCYKWGYFTKVPENVKKTQNEATKLMWCGRFIDWKHPELAIECAKKLKDKGYKFQLDMFGDGILRKGIEVKVKKLGLSDLITFHGNVANTHIYEAMGMSDIFLFTSDRLEGWGAIATESLSNGCVLVASDTIGSTPYLIKDGFNGFNFRSCDSESLTDKISWLLNHKDEMQRMQGHAIATITTLWNPYHAAISLLQLISNIQNNICDTNCEGPCSYA